MTRAARVLASIVLLSAVLVAMPGTARAALSAPEGLTYLPNGFVTSLKTNAQVDDYLASLDAYGIGQALLQLPGFQKAGSFSLSAHMQTMLARWTARANAYNAAHGTDVAVTAVFNGDVDNWLNLDDAATRASIVATVRSVVQTYGVLGVHLDLEPYPTTAGFLSLLDELNASFAAIGFSGRLSTVAPATTSVWSASYLHQVSTKVDQLNPLFYDSDLSSVAQYKTWVQGSLAYYSANAQATARIIPVLPSYSPNQWHDPAIENLTTSSAAVAAALSAGSRVDGAAIWWWWGFYYDEGGTFNGAADRSAWQSSTRQLAFAPEVNRAPTFTANPLVKPAAPAGTSYGGTLAGDATDADGDTLLFTKLSGPAWLGVAPNGTLSGTPADAQNGWNTFIVRATDPGGRSAYATLAIYVTCTLSAPWHTVLIGGVGPPGLACNTGATHTISGSGVIKGVADGFRFVAQDLQGNGSITARLRTSGSGLGSSRVGVMMRESATPGSKHAFLAVNARGAVKWMRRVTTNKGTPTTASGSGAAPNLWLRLVRTGSTIAASRSVDGVTWTPVGSVSISMPADAQVGLAVASGNVTNLYDVVMDNVAVVP